MRIVSLLPSATEMLFALGFDHEIVGVSHECDFPPRAKTKSVVIRSRLPKDATPGEIDRLVREYLGRGESLYSVDADLIEALAPDLIVTQDLCHVCAASPDDLASALARFRRRPEVLCLNPQDLGDVWRDILWVGEETGHDARAQALVEKIAMRLGEAGMAMASTRLRPGVVLLEWLQPFYIGGHWVPEMIERAGGVNLLGKAKTPSYRITVEEIVAAAPEVLLIAPCGYTKEQAREEYLSITFPETWKEIPAVRNGRVYALDANSFVSRPGPRLVTGIEAMLKILHPSLQVPEKAAGAFVRIDTTGQTTKSASA
jgi:iron complex transport system substrate-binding protein